LKFLLINFCGYGTRFFGLLGGNNDVNVFDKSPFVAKLLRSEEVGYVLSTLLFVGKWNLPPLELFCANHT
jgi:hypothetical protein